MNPDAKYETWWHMKGEEGYTDWSFAAADVDDDEKKKEEASS